MAGHDLSMHTTAIRPPGFISSLIAIGAARLAARLPMLGSDQAAAVMAEVADDLCANFGRTELYIPARCADEREARNAGICAQYAEDGPDGVRGMTAERAAQLAKNHRLSVRQMRTILSRAKPETQA